MTSKLPSHHAATLRWLFPFSRLRFLCLIDKFCYETIVCLGILLQRFSRLQQVRQECGGIHRLRP